MRMIAYRRVSREEQTKSGLGLEAQRQAIRAAARGRGWRLQWITDESKSAKDLRRAGIQEALGLLKDGKAQGLVVSRLDRLSRSLLDFAGLMARSRHEGWCVVALDLNVDTSTPSGEALANVMAALAQFERRLIGQRTREALAVLRARGKKLGRPRVLPSGVIKRIQRQRWRGCSYDRIARSLNRSRVPTAHGAPAWRPGSVWLALPANARRRIRERLDRSQRNGRTYREAVRKAAR